MSTPYIWSALQANEHKIYGRNENLARILEMTFTPFVDSFWKEAWATAYTLWKEDDSTTILPLTYRKIDYIITLMKNGLPCSKCWEWHRVVPTACTQTHSSQRQASTTLSHNHIPSRLRKRFADHTANFGFAPPNSHIFVKPYKHPYMIRCYDNVIISNRYKNKYSYRERDADRCSVTRNIILFIWVKVNDSKCRFV